MVHFFRFRPLAWAAAALIASPFTAWSQQPTLRPHTPAAAKPRPAISSPQASEMLNAELFYEALVGEMTTSAGDPATGYALMLEAARRSNDPDLYRRATEIALQARSGDSALDAVQAWKAAQPQSRDASRYQLQILVALNRTGETAEPLRQVLASTPDPLKAAVLQSIPALYARVSDKALAASVVEKALAGTLNDPALGSSAWASVGRLRLAAGDKQGALAAARRAQAFPPVSDNAALLAMGLSEAGVQDAEPLITQYFDNPEASPELRMAYARSLISQQHYPEATRQLDLLTRAKPDLPDPWLVLAMLQLQNNQVDEASASADQFSAAVNQLPEGDARQDGLNRGYLLRAQIAEKRKQYDEAENWLARVDGPALFDAQVRRASLAAHQGKLAYARALIHSLPAKTPEEERQKTAAEVQLLRENRQYQDAYDLQAQLAAQSPDDDDLLYDQAMLAEKAGKPELMEQLLRKLIARQPGYAQALNALGYSLADRGVRLPEAKRLIEKALDQLPGDPFITDSLGWVEFRMGRREKALELLQQAFEKKQDPEIAAHLGEVFWSLNQRDAALAAWRKGLQMSPDNEVLQETIKRLGAQP
ncbi:MAG: tetratricopeptide repeat protein [Acidovorax sp.]